MSNLIDRALHFASDAHDGQARKYTGEPYINHCIAVSELVRKASYYNDEMVAAALLHDTVEDTETTIKDISDNFGGIVAIFVDGLTDVSKPDDGNREARKAIDREHLSHQLPPVQTIKLADLIDNSRSIVERDPSFAKVYMREKKLLLNVLTDGDFILRNMAQDIIDNYYFK